METPNYLASLETVARHYGGLTDLDEVGQTLVEQWGRFERVAKNWSYDVLEIGDAETEREMSAVLQTLYRIPGVNWKNDCGTIRTKDKEYGGSWCRRGGQGAFMMLARKFDRIEKALAIHGSLAKLIQDDVRTEGVLDDLQDLRCYLLLCLSWRHEKRNPTVAQAEIAF